MAWTESTSGNATTDGTEQTLATVTAAGTYVLYLDTANMASGDALEVRAYVMPKTAETERLLYGPKSGMTFWDVQEEPMKVTVPVNIIASASVRFTIKRIAGTDRTYKWFVDVI